MKNLILGLSLLISFSTLAECVDRNGNDIFSEPDTFQGMIATASSCYEAKKLAESCAYGSSMDIQTAGLAIDVCKKEMNSKGISAEQDAILVLMESQCNKKYSDMAGTMYRSINMFCHLEAASFINNLGGDI